LSPDIAPVATLRSSFCASFNNSVAVYPERSEGSQSVHRSVILFGLFHAATAAQLDVIFAEFNNRRDLREKKEQNEKDLHHRTLHYQPGFI